MTTIIADKRTLSIASDRQTSDRGLRGQATKIGRAYIPEDNQGSSCCLKPGTFVLYGTGGNNECHIPFVKWVEQGMDAERRPTFADMGTGENFQALVLCDDGKLFQIETHCSPIIVEEPFYAIGSGNMAAMAAMLCGKDVYDAVEIACIVDMYSGGGVDILTLEKSRLPVSGNGDILHVHS